MSDKKPMIELNQVTFCYPAASEPVIHDISLSVFPSEIVILCGQSGCGKSTLLRHMKKNQIPFGSGSGTIFFDGMDLETMDDREAARRIGFVGQDPDAQIVTDTVWHELAFGLENMGVSSGEVRRRTAEMSEYLGIGALFRRPVEELSGGQKQLLNLASVLVMKPDLIILDEPTAQMDPLSASRFLQTLIRLNQDFGMTMIMSEQRLEETLSLADRVLFMHEGRIIADGRTAQSAKLLAQCEHKLKGPLPVRDALPVAVRVSVAARTEKQKSPCPVSVREGREWLRASIQMRMGGRQHSYRKKDDFTESCEYGEKILEGRAISYSYTKGKYILEDFSISVPKGSFFAILGGNGSGKTTALKLLSGVYAKGSRGKVIRRGKTLYLAQNPQSLFTEVAVEEELMAVLDRKVSTEEMKKETGRMLHFLELDGLEESNPMDLSGGEKQRLALGKILLRRPEVLLLDEPTKGLDAAFKNKLSQLFQKLRKEGMTIVMASHDLEFCAANATHCGLLFDGALISEGPVRDFFAGNAFYTTAAARMAEGILPDCLLCEDIVEQISDGEGDAFEPDTGQEL